jgi:hypothetical protein
MFGNNGQYCLMLSNNVIKMFVINRPSQFSQMETTVPFPQQPEQFLYPIPN